MNISEFVWKKTLKRKGCLSLHPFVAICVKLPAKEPVCASSCCGLFYIKSIDFLFFSTPQCYSFCGRLQLLILPGKKNRRSSEKELEELKVTAENCLLKNAKTRHNSLEELQQNSFQKKRNSD